MLSRARLPLVMVIASFAAVVAVALEAPARTILVPETLMRTVTLKQSEGPSRVRLQLPPTHLAFSWKGDEGTGVEFRTITDEGLISNWTVADEAYDARRADQHFTAVLRVDRPAAIDWRPVRPKDAKMGPVTLDVMNTEDGPQRIVEIARTAYATANTPRIVTRAEWGANESVKRTGGSCKRKFFPVQQLFVHHTVGRNNDSNPHATMRAIYQYHAVRQGWCDVGYNFVIGWDGTIFEGRWARSYKPWETHSSENRLGHVVAGAHVAGYNSGSVGVSLMGNFETAPIPAKMRRSLAEFLAWEADRHGLKPRQRHTYRNPETGATRKLPIIAGHRDAGQTACPGRYVYRALDGIRRDTRAVMGDGKANTRIQVASSTKHVLHGEPVTVSGTLTDESGQALSGKPVTIYRRPAGGRWQTAAVVATGAVGGFRHTLSPKKNQKVIAYFDGDGTFWGAQTKVLNVPVRPVVTVEAEGGQKTLTGQQRFPASTTAVRVSGNVTPNHVGHTVKAKVWRVGPTGRLTHLRDRIRKITAGGNYTWDFHVPSSGDYRVIVWFQKHANHHAASPSPELFFTVEG